jgi:hypothetical protein
VNAEKAFLDHVFPTTLITRSSPVLSRRGHCHEDCLQSVDKAVTKAVPSWQDGCYGEGRPQFDGEDVIATLEALQVRALPHVYAEGS